MLGLHTLLFRLSEFLKIVLLRMLVFLTSRYFYTGYGLHQAIQPFYWSTVKIHNQNLLK